MGNVCGKSGDSPRQRGIERDLSLPLPPPRTTEPLTLMNYQNAGDVRRRLMAMKYSYIPDNYSSLEQASFLNPYQRLCRETHDPFANFSLDTGALCNETDNVETNTGGVDLLRSSNCLVTAALRESGLESSNLIVGIDFTKSNEWTGKHSFGNQSLHAIGGRSNPYEEAITIVGKALAPFDEDNLIPCFGFGDATTHDREVFSFHRDHSPCHGFEEVLACYRKIVPTLRLSGPTSFAPIVEAAVDIVERSGGQYHVLIIIADGQVTRSVDTNIGDFSPQEMQTINSIVTASAYPLSIVLVGVGDGPWEDMQKFDDKIPSRKFDNFQFVNYTAIMARNTNPEQKDAAFALAALMEIPIQYKASMEFGLLGRVTGKAKRAVPRPPPSFATYQQQQPSSQREIRPPQLSSSERNQECPICLANTKDLAFGCGHMCCRECGQHLVRCPICRKSITSSLRLYSG